VTLFPVFLHVLTSFFLLKIRQVEVIIFDLLEV